MKRHVITLPLIVLALSLATGCLVSKPNAGEKLLPYLPEPAFVVLEYLPKDKVLEATYPRTIDEILKGRQFIMRHFRSELPLKRDGFSYEKSLGVKIGNHHYRRDIYVYTYLNIETHHGPPTQEITIWYDFRDFEATNVWKVFTGEPRWPL